MRTTVTLDDDLAAALKQRSRERDVPFKQVLNDAIREGLSGPPQRRKPYKMKPARDLRPRPGVDLTKALQLAAELEDEEIIKKLREGR